MTDLNNPDPFAPRREHELPLLVEISGWPLGKPDEDDEPTPLPIIRVSPAALLEDGPPYVTDREGAETVLRAWANAPAVDYDTGETEWLRTYEFHEIGEVFATALAGDGELNISWWVESGGLFYIEDWPFDFEVRLLTDEEADAHG